MFETENQTKIHDLVNAIREAEDLRLLYLSKGKPILEKAVCLAFQLGEQPPSTRLIHFRVYKIGNIEIGATQVINYVDDQRQKGFYSVRVTVGTTFAAFVRFAIDAPNDEKISECPIGFAYYPETPDEKFFILPGAAWQKAIIDEYEEANLSRELELIQALEYKYAQAQRLVVSSL